MRVGIIGNMNNAGFCIMRYLRDLGLDAELLLFSTDGAGNLAHFAPEADTWYISQWRPFIHQMEVANQASTVLGSFKELRLPWTSRALKQQLDGYDRYIGSGIAPAICNQAGIDLDIFFPYGTGIEFYGTLELQASRRNPLKRIWLDRLRSLQAKGIRASKHCLNAELSLTKQSFDAMGKNFERCFLPAVYNKEPKPADTETHVGKVCVELKSYDFVVFSHARQLWIRKKQFSEAEWRSQTKNSDFLIRGYDEFTRMRPSARALLVLLEYGEDVEQSKALCRELRIESKVRWIQKTTRRNLALYLEHSDVGVGEFYLDHGVIWGGTGWEILAAGKPLLQSFNYDRNEFESLFDVPVPPVIHCSTPSQVASSLVELYDQPDRRTQIGQESLLWFDRYGGEGLAKRWADCLKPGIGCEGRSRSTHD